ncbi:hypothetical protein BN2476_490040 [Paraburkholderia piptadeniae]|uniref:Uncharacterized protein n=1 Tax=Paraburkholderia piptadeniae TaxID=1701573 RepID=A0A1N7SES1_9BURK|nr:hypothetical protein BN2476_490040 [Paraburkholderia piptadeniae]
MARYVPIRRGASSNSRASALPAMYWPVVHPATHQRLENMSDNEVNKGTLHRFATIDALSARGGRVSTGRASNVCRPYSGVCWRY